MKQLFTCLLGWLLLAGPARAQSPDPVRQQLDHLFANLDKSQIPTGRLLEAAVPLGPVASFDGTLRDSARADMDTFRHLYATALSARLADADTETLPTLPDFNQLVSAAAPATPGGAIAVAIQYIGYNRLRPDAETAGLVRLQNQQLTDVPGRSTSPYQAAVLFAAAPERTYSASADVSLVIRRNLFLTSDVAIRQMSLYLDFGNGQGYQAAGWDQPLSTSYDTGGRKRVKVKLAHISGSVIRESWFDLTVAAPDPSPEARYLADITYSPTKGFDQAFAGNAPYPLAATDYTHHLGAMVNVRYGAGHTSIKKPFIVVEGYNTAAIAPHLIGENNKNNTITQFLDQISSPYTSPYDFNHNLEQAGYDLIYIDFNNGTDDIRRNAKLFEEVLAWVNTEKQNNGSTEQNVVMGESMGGLVARYGLARLVRTGYNPQTRLLILHDSPQRGANNPMGLQALTRQIDFPIAILPGNNQGGARGIVRTSDLSDKLKEGLRVLEAPATKQLSIKNVTGINNEYDNNTFIDGPYKDVVDFGNAPPAAFPSIIATSDGSQCGQPQSTPVYQELTRNDRNYLLGSVAAPFHLGVQTEAIVNGLPAYGTQNTIAHLRVWFTVRVLWLRLDINLLNRNYTSPANTLPYETLPGGTNNLNEQQGLTTNHANGFLGFWDLSDNTTLYDGNICFVPTYSALNVPTVTPATAYARYINGATDNPAPPSSLASYIAMENSNGTQFNQPHLRFTARNSEWLYSQMQNDLKHAEQVACATECSAVASTISGPTQLCPGAAGTYTIGNLPAGVQVRWLVTTSGVVTPGSSTGSSFTVQALAGADGNTTIQATLVSAAGGCERPLAELPVSVSGSRVGIGITGDCAGQVATFSADGQNIGTNYRWAINGQAQPRFDNLAQIDYTLPTDPSVDYITVSVAVAGTCASSGTVASTTQVHVTHDAGCANNLTAPQSAPASATLYPNPTHESLYVHLENADTARPTTVRLFDSRGRPALEQSSKGEATIKVKVNKLPSGLYFVHVLRGSEVLTRQQLRLE